MNRLLERRRAMMMAKTRRTGIATIVPNALVSGYTFDTITNASRAYTSASSTTYANLTSTTANKECESFWTFGTLDIPSGAVITHVECKVNAFGDFSTRYARFYLGDTAKGVTFSLGSGSSDATRLLYPGALTLADIPSVKLRIWATHQNNTTTNSLRFYGATFSILWDTNPVYYNFYDQEVEDVLADVIGDGTGTTWEAMQFITQFPAQCFKDNTNVVSFDELQHFGSLKSIGSSAFYGCSNLESISIPESVTSIGSYCFYNCTSISNLYIPCSAPWYAFRDGNTANTRNIGAGTGDLIINGSMNKGDANYKSNINFRFKHVIVNGDFTHPGGSKSGTAFVGTAIIRFNGSYIIYNNTTMSGNKPFVEVMGDLTATDSNSRLNASSGSSISHVHLGRTSIITATPTQMSIGTLTNIYVGDGSSKQNDEDVLALYLADSNWSAQSAKLATWWDYNGTYKWYYVTDNLTNCTNTNPNAWPHITRGDSYHTQIVADDGYTLSSVQVQMYQCEDNTATPNTPTDITSQVYDSSTGEINIEHVLGNVIITATAS